MDTTVNNLGIYLRKRRKEMSLTIQECAEELGVTQGYVSNVENGKRTPSINFINKIAALFVEPESELLKRIDKPTQAMKNTLNIYNSLAKSVPGPILLSNLRVQSMKTRLEIENETDISPMKQRLIENQGINDIELFNKYGQALGVNNLYEFLYSRTKIPYANWWGVDAIKDMTEQEYNIEYYSKEIKFKKSLEKFNKEHVSLNDILQNTKHLYFNDNSLSEYQRDKIRRFLEILFEDDK